MLLSSFTGNIPIEIGRIVNADDNVKYTPKSCIGIFKHR